MKGRRASLSSAAALALPLAQLGHQLAYVAHYGAAGLAYQSRSVHGYFPELLKLSGAALGLAALAAVLALGAARVARSGATAGAVRREVGWTVGRCRWWRRWRS